MGPFVGSYSQVLFVDDLGTELAGQQFGSVGAGLVEYLVVLAHPLVLRRRGRLGRRWGRLTGRSWSRLLGRPLDGLRVTATLSHPLGRVEPRALRFVTVADGSLRSAEALPAGRWRLRLEITAQGEKWRTERDVP